MNTSEIFSQLAGRMRPRTLRIVVLALYATTNTPTLITLLVVRSRNVRALADGDQSSEFGTSRPQDSVDGVSDETRVRAAEPTF